MAEEIIFLFLSLYTFEITALIFVILGCCLCFNICYLRKRKGAGEMDDDDDDDDLTDQKKLTRNDVGKILQLLKFNGLLENSYYTLCIHLDDVNCQLIDDIVARYGNKTDIFLRECLIKWLDNPKTLRDLTRGIINANEHSIAEQILKEKNQAFVVLKNHVPNILKNLQFPFEFFHILSYEDVIDVKSFSDGKNKEVWLLSQLKESVYKNQDTIILKFTEVLEICGCRQIAITILKEYGHQIFPVMGENDMGQDFEKLFIEMEEIITKEDIDIETLEDCVMCDPNSTLKLRMKGCTTTKSFWKLLKEDCSSINIGSLENIVNRLQVKQSMEHIQQYNDSIKKYCTRKQISDCSGILFHRLPSLQCQIITLVLKRSLTCDTLWDIKIRLKNLFNDDSKYIKIVKISLKRHKFVITCSFPVTLTENLLANGRKNLPGLEQDLIELTIGHCTLCNDNKRVRNIEPPEDSMMIYKNELQSTSDQTTMALIVQIMEKKEKLGNTNQSVQFFKENNIEMQSSASDTGKANILLRRECKELKKAKSESDLRNEKLHAEIQSLMEEKEKISQTLVSQKDMTIAVMVNRIKEEGEHAGCEHSLNIFKLKTNCRQIHDKIFKCTYGTPSDTKPTKVIMLVGETGTGKSTLINGMVNYILGIKFEDDFRFKLIYDDETKEFQAHSQTDTITAYTLYWQEGFKVPYNLTIIDTPGFGDTLKKDDETIQMINKLFSIERSDNINEIHSIGFVTQSTSSFHLTPTQLYNISSILGLFGKDFGEDNISVFVTNDDNSCTEVLQSLKKAKVPFAKNFYVNNWGLYHDPNDPMTKPLWDKSNNNYQLFLCSLEVSNPVGLQLTLETLKEREKLHVTLNDMYMLIQEGLAKMDAIHKQKEILEQKEADMKANEKYDDEVQVTKTEKVDLTNGESAVNCMNCNMTCSWPFNQDYKIYECAAMDTGRESDARCVVCPRKCSWKDHQKNETHHFEKYEKTERRRSDEKFQHYQQAETDKNNVEQVISSIQGEVDELSKKVHKEIEKINETIAQLNKIALEPNPLGKAEYLDLLIEKEKKEKEDGHLERIEKYTKVKEQAQMLADISCENKTEVKYSWQFWLT